MQSATVKTDANIKHREVLLKQIAAVIRENRWSQIQAAQVLGVSQPRISYIMKGKADLFSIDTLINLAANIGYEANVSLKMTVQ